MGTYIGQIKIDSGDVAPVASTLYGTCTTIPGTAAKVATVTGFDKLITGVTVHIKFTNSNTAANPTLNVNGTGAKTIMRYGTTSIPAGSGDFIHANAIISFTYDGTYWQMNDYLDHVARPTGVKGNAESSYRTGNVNLTPANIGAVSLSGDNDISTPSITDGITVIANNSTENITQFTPNKVFINHNSSTGSCSLLVQSDHFRLGYNNSNSGKYSILDIITPEYGKKWDIRRLGSDSPEWAGISGSLDETLTKIWTTRGVQSWTTQNTVDNPATAAKVINTEAGQTITSHGGAMLFHYFGVIKTSRYTSYIRLFIDDVETAGPPSAFTNSTTPMKVDAIYTVTLSAGTHNVKLKLIPQDNGTTATLLAYNTFGWSAIET